MMRRLSLLVLFASLLAGCSSLTTDPDLRGPVRVPANVRGSSIWLSEIRRVAVLPAYDATGRLTPEFVDAYNAAWSRALDQSQRAEFVVIDRRTLSVLTGRETISSTAPMPDALLASIVRETGAEAVMFLDLTHAGAYPPLSLGFRAKLVHTSSARIIWSVDELFDSADAPTARAARLFAKANAQGAGDPTTAVLQSPSRFASYAFQAVATLLPPRPSPAPTATTP